MKLHEILIAAVIEGDPEAEAVAAELIGSIKVSDLTAEQIASLLDIKSRWDIE